MRAQAGNKNELRNDGSFFQNELLRLLNCNYYKTFKENLPKTSGYPGWSPNNVRRLVISPDGILVQYHTTVKAKLPSNRLTHIKLFNVEEATQALQSGKCKPMLQVLGKNRVYSAIEEIILLSKGDNGLYLLNDELNLKSIGIDNKGDIAESLKARYLRMYGIGVVNNLSLKEFVDKYQSLLSKKNTSIVLHMKNEGEAMKTLLVGGRKAFGCMPNLQRYSNSSDSGYMLDASVLSDYFKDMTEEFKAQEKQKTRVEKTIEVSDSCIKSINLYIKVLTHLGNSLSRGNARPTVRRVLPEYDNKESSTYLKSALSVYDITSENLFSDREMIKPEGLSKVAQSVITWLFKCNTEKLRYFIGYEQLRVFLKICVYFNMYNILEKVKNDIPQTFETALESISGSKFVLDERGVQSDTSKVYTSCMAVYGKFANLFRKYWSHAEASTSDTEYNINNITTGVYIIEKICTKRIKKSDYSISDCRYKIEEFLK